MGFFHILDVLGDCKTFECPNHLKCADTYCVPWGYRCDGKPDCPHAEDEKSCLDKNCHNLLKCKESIVCVHVTDTCNGRADCPLGEDELFCDLPVCPDGCTCLHYAMTFSNFNSIMKMNNNLPFLYISISKSTISHGFIKFLVGVKVLRLQNNSAKTSYFADSKIKLITTMVDLSFNQIHLKKDCFRSISNVLSLNLSFNSISSIPRQTFISLKMIIHLDLSFNSIRLLKSKSFVNQNHLKRINLLQSLQIKLEMDVFENLDLEVVFTDTFHINCFVKNSTSKIIWPFTCGHLLGTTALRISLWILSFSIIIFNVISIGISHNQIKSSSSSQIQKGTTYKSCIILLNMSDCCIGVQLLTLASADLYYGEKYIIYDTIWRSSAICHTISLLSLAANLLSMYILAFIAVSRLILVIFPMSEAVKRRKTLFFVIGAGLFGICTFLVTIIFTMAHSNDEGAIQPLPLCLMYGVSGRYTFISVVYGTAQLTSTFFILVIYIILVFALSKARKRRQEITSANNPHDTSVSLSRLVIVNLSNFFCWIPSSVLLFVSLGVDKYPISLLFWVTMVLTPINSVINPCVLQFTSLHCQFKMREKYQ